MDKPFPVLCMDCKHAEPDSHSSWNNRCFHPKVVAADSWALANNNEGKPYGVSCYDERRKKSPFAACGMRGKLWVNKGE